MGRLAVMVATLGVALSACSSGGGSGAAGNGEGDGARDKAARPPTTATPAASCGAGAGGATGRLAPASGAWFGVNLDWAKDSPGAIADRLGVSPAVFVEFAEFPVAAESWKRLDGVVGRIREAGAMALLTLEPHGGLAAVTDKAVDALATHLAAYNRRGVPVFVRFAHEMNGSWYAWSQQPAEYVAAFRKVAAAVHAEAPTSAMVWAPNYGGGYPFPGRYAAAPGTPAFGSLDTDGDGRLSMADDPYQPYYPGDDAVDWVGMSLYHWGSSWPWGENERPEAGKLVAQLTGEYRGASGDERSLPDFYATYAGTKGKPLAITETAAFYAPGAGAADKADEAEESAIKGDWWQQVFAVAADGRFPRLAMVNWFEWDKVESEVKARVNWGVSRRPALAGAFRAALPPTLRMSDDVPRCAT